MAEVHHTLISKTRPGPNGCVEWTAYRINGGYGRLRVGQKMKLAHRVSYELSIGPIPDELCVLHRCDNRGCINPDHFFLGTYKDNCQDMYAKGRNRPALGDRNVNNKLTPEQIVQIRKDKRGKTVIAKEFGINRSTVADIRNRKIWKHIP